MELLLDKQYPLVSQTSYKLGKPFCHRGDGYQLNYTCVVELATAAENELQLQKLQAEVSGLTGQVQRANQKSTWLLCVQWLVDEEHVRPAEDEKDEDE